MIFRFIFHSFSVHLHLLTLKNYGDTTEIREGELSYRFALFPVEVIGAAIRTMHLVIGNG